MDALQPSPDLPVTVKVNDNKYSYLTDTADSNDEYEDFWKT